MGEVFQQRRAEALPGTDEPGLRGLDRAAQELHLFFPRPPLSDKNP
jgi:hypothetical protein